MNFYETNGLCAAHHSMETAANRNCTLTKFEFAGKKKGLLTNISTNMGAAKSESQYERDQSSFVELMFVAATAATAADRCLNLLILFGLYCRLQGHVEKFTPN